MDTQLKEKIKALAKSNSQKIIAIRRHLHAHPELSFQEFNTAKFIAEKLRNEGIAVQEGIAQTGLLATIQGKNPTKRATALRADIDALPIQEANNVPYKSTVEGVMHACGHDVHTASLIGTASILNTLKDEFEGTIKLIFQLAEEKAPGGALSMVKEGVLENPKPVSILGQHVYVNTPVGKVGFVEGISTASADDIYITVKGKGGHAAMPERNVDPVVMASHIIIALQQIVSRNCNPITPCVLSFGKVVADGVSNVIPNKVSMEGTFRTLDEEWREEAHQKITHIAQGMAEAMGGSCECTIVKGYPPLEQDAALTKRAKEGAEEFIGKENVVDLTKLMGAEDFAYYAKKTAGCFYLLGVGNEAQGITSNVHTPTFDIDERALTIGVGLMAWLALKELSLN